jgi:uncharacterized protein YndB with AHSA1/START domain
MFEPIRELTLVRNINASVEEVFQALTEPDKMKQWWGPNGVSVPVCEVDLKPGGKINIVMLAGSELGEMSGQEWPMTGTYTEIIPPSKIVYMAHPIMNGESVMDTLNTITLEDKSGKTELKVQIGVANITPEAEGPLAGMEIGWNQSLDKLTKFVEP